MPVNTRHRASWTRPSLGLSVALALGALLACGNSGDGGISASTACTSFCDWSMACADVEPVDEDNYLAECMNLCVAADDEVRRDNPDDQECIEAYRSITTSISSEATCPDIATDFNGVCVSEVFDVAEFCENPP